MSSLIVKVCTVYKIEKHPNADRLSIVTVDNESGWSCIVGLDQYKPGDKIVYIPPDAVIPPEMIEKYNLEYLKHNGRTGTVKLRGYISQGLVLDVPEGKYKVGDDVANVFGITKYEPPQSKYSVKGAEQISKKKINPNFDKYTDIENIKNFNGIFTSDDTVVITEKIHGANSRFGNLEIHIDRKQPFFELLQNLFDKYILRKTHQFVYGSHNVQITGHSNRNSYYGEDVWGKVAEKYNLAEVILPDHIVYGEVYGERIQDLTYGIKGIDLVVFDIKFKDKYLPWDAVKYLCDLWLLKTVPELYEGKYSDDLLSMTVGNSILCSTQMREGIVIKMLYEANNPRIGRKILKSISTEYLARKNGTEYQ